MVNPLPLSGFNLNNYMDQEVKKIGSRIFNKSNKFHLGLNKKTPEMFVRKINYCGLQGLLMMTPLY